jgi:hypothetical protein
LVFLVDNIRVDLVEMGLGDVDNIRMDLVEMGLGDVD